jgi:hypothetical protein
MNRDVDIEVILHTGQANNYARPFSRRSVNITSPSIYPKIHFFFNKPTRLVKWHDASLTQIPLRISPLVGSALSMDVIAEDLISREKRPSVRIWY